MNSGNIFTGRIFFKESLNSGSFCIFCALIPLTLSYWWLNVRHVLAFLTLINIYEVLLVYYS